jgi:acetate CoA/acetoacetate CoA-transferase beta subunit
MEYIANKNIVAKRIAGIFKTGEVINLGIGLPTLVEKYIPQNVSIALQSENGIMGIGPTPAKGQRGQGSDRRRRFPGDGLDRGLLL